MGGSKGQGVQSLQGPLPIYSTASSSLRLSGISSASNPALESHPHVLTLQANQESVAVSNHFLQDDRDEDASWCKHFVILN